MIRKADFLLYCLKQLLVEKLYGKASSSLYMQVFLSHFLFFLYLELRESSLQNVLKQTWSGQILMQFQLVNSIQNEMWSVRF